MHRAEQIIDAIVAALQASTALGVSAANVFAHRTLSLSESQGEMPAVCVNAGDDEPSNEYDTLNDEIGSALEITTIAYWADVDEPSVKRALFAARTEIHKAINPAATLNLDFVLKVEYGGAAKAETDASGELCVGAQESRWLITYHMDPSDPS